MTSSDIVFRVASFIDMERRMFKKRKIHHFPVNMVKFSIVAFENAGKKPKPNWEDEVDTDSAMVMLEAEDVIKWLDTKNGEYYFKVLPKFDDYYKKQWDSREANLEKLSDSTLLRLYDVALDIKEKIELGGLQTKNTTLFIRTLGPSKTN